MIKNRRSAGELMLLLVEFSNLQLPLTFNCLLTRVKPTVHSLRVYTDIRTFSAADT